MVLLTLLGGAGFFGFSLFCLYVPADAHSADFKPYVNRTGTEARLPVRRGPGDARELS
jgi:hypothetical protein